HSTAGLARQARNEALQIGYGGAIHLSSPQDRRWFRKQESPKQPMLVKSQSRFTCFWPSPKAPLEGPLSASHRLFNSTSLSPLGDGARSNRRKICYESFARTFGESRGESDVERMTGRVDRRAVL